MKKMDFLKKVAGSFGLVAAFATTARLSFAEGSMDGSVAASAVTEVGSAQSGRAQLGLSDLKTLLGGVRPSTDGSAAHENFYLPLSKTEQAKLMHKVHALEAERSKLEANLAQDAAKKKAELRAQRRELQASRLTAREDKDRELSRKLYDSLLEEANLEARAQNKLASFDANNAIYMDFIEINGSRQVATIHIGGTRVWDSTEKTTVAKK